jgi:hypothetical protein
MKKPNKYTLIFKGKLEDFDQKALDFEYWKDKSTTEKFEEARKLADHVMLMQGKNYKDVSRLLRTTAVLKRQ